jgi:hypothetical protein
MSLYRTQGDHNLAGLSVRRMAMRSITDVQRHTLPLWKHVARLERRSVQVVALFTQQIGINTPALSNFGVMTFGKSRSRNPPVGHVVMLSGYSTTGATLQNTLAGCRASSPLVASPRRGYSLPGADGGAACAAGNFSSVRALVAGPDSLTTVDKPVRAADGKSGWRQAS